MLRNQSRQPSSCLGCLVFAIFFSVSWWTVSLLLSLALIWFVPAAYKSDPRWLKTVITGASIHSGVLAGTLARYAYLSIVGLIRPHVGRVWLYAAATYAICAHTCLALIALFTYLGYLDFPALDNDSLIPSLILLTGVLAATFARHIFESKLAKLT